MAPAIAPKHNGGDFGFRYFCKKASFERHEITCKFAGDVHPWNSA